LIHKNHFRGGNLNRKLLLLLALVSVLLAGCGGVAAAKSVGDPMQGKTFFNQAAIREAPAVSPVIRLSQARSWLGHLWQE
jgi:hypothetical protein